LAPEITFAVRHKVCRQDFFDIRFLKIRIDAMLRILQGQPDVGESGRPAKDGTRKLFSVEGVSASN
jgi:hypothetical protein